MLLVHVPVADADHDGSKPEDDGEEEREEDDDLAAFPGTETNALESHAQAPPLSGTILDSVAGCSSRIVAFAVSVILNELMKKNL